MMYEACMCAHIYPYIVCIDDKNVNTGVIYIHGKYRNLTNLIDILESALEG